MIFTSFLAILLAAINPAPILLQGFIDSAKIIGLPRLKTMDKFFAKAICIDEVQGEMAYIIYSRKDFLKNYIKINS
ncbi:hypothetical protein G6724_05535 [Polynucleobacter paneuropaeus]|nr:hypothetical protein [Polynucleobacter paneuropaeus]